MVENVRERAAPSKRIIANLGPRKSLSARGVSTVWRARSPGWRSVRWCVGGLRRSPAQQCVGGSGRVLFERLWQAVGCVPY